MDLSNQVTCFADRLLFLTIQLVFESSSSCCRRFFFTSKGEDLREIWGMWTWTFPFQLSAPTIWGPWAQVWEAWLGRLAIRGQGHDGRITLGVSWWPFWNDSPNRSWNRGKTNHLRPWRAWRWSFKHPILGPWPRLLFAIRLLAMNCVRLVKVAKLDTWCSFLLKATRHWFLESGRGSLRCEIGVLMWVSGIPKHPELLVATIPRSEGCAEIRSSHSIWLDLQNFKEEFVPVTVILLVPLSPTCFPWRFVASGNSTDCLRAFWDSRLVESHHFLGTIPQFFIGRNPGSFGVVPWFRKAGGQVGLCCRLRGWKPGLPCCPIRQWHSYCGCHILIVSNSAHYLGLVHLQRNL